MIVQKRTDLSGLAKDLEAALKLTKTLTSHKGYNDFTDLKIERILYWFLWKLRSDFRWEKLEELPFFFMIKQTVFQLCIIFGQGAQTQRLQLNSSLIVSSGFFHKNKIRFFTIIYTTKRHAKQYLFLCRSLTVSDKFNLSV